VRSLGGRGHPRRPVRPGTDDVGGAVSTAIPWPTRSRARASRETPRSARRRRRVVGDDVQAAEASSTTARRHRVPRPPRGRAAAPNGLIPRDATRAERRARRSPSGCGRTGQARQAVSSLGSAGELTAPATPGGPRPGPTGGLAPAVGQTRFTGEPASSGAGAPAQPPREQWRVGARAPCPTRTLGGPPVVRASIARAAPRRGAARRSGPPTGSSWRPDRPDPLGLVRLSSADATDRWQAVTGAPRGSAVT
jgi:hypothetical protein